MLSFDYYQRTLAFIYSSFGPANPTQNTADVDLQDLKWRYNQLQTQYDYINSKYNAHMEGSKHSDVKLEVRYHSFV